MLVLRLVLVTHAVVDSHLHVWDETAAGLDPGPMKVGYSAQATASVELFMDYMDEAGVARAVFVQPWFYHWDNSLHGPVPPALPRPLPRRVRRSTPAGPRRRRRSGAGGRRA